MFDPSDADVLRAGLQQYLADIAAIMGDRRSHRIDANHPMRLSAHAHHCARVRLRRQLGRAAPARSVVIGMLPADDSGQPRGRRDVILGAVGRQPAQGIDEWQLALGAVLDARRQRRGVIECASGDRNAIGRFVGQRRSALGAKAAPNQVGGLEMSQPAARPAQPSLADGDQCGVIAAECFLAHAAMTDRGIAQTACNAETNRAALATATVVVCVHLASISQAPRVARPENTRHSPSPSKRKSILRSSRLAFSTITRTRSPSRY